MIIEGIIIIAIIIIIIDIIIIIIIMIIIIWGYYKFSPHHSVDNDHNDYNRNHHYNWAHNDLTDYYYGHPIDNCNSVPDLIYCPWGIKVQF